MFLIVIKKEAAMKGDGEGQRGLRGLRAELGLSVGLHVAELVIAV